MNAPSKREIVVEFERVQLVRKRARTLFMICKECGCKADFVSLDDASAVFETKAADLYNFAAANNCHIHKNPAGGIHICLVAFISAMKLKNPEIRLLGE